MFMLKNILFMVKITEVVLKITPVMLKNNRGGVGFRGVEIEFWCQNRYEKKLLRLPALLFLL